MHPPKKQEQHHEPFDFQHDFTWRIFRVMAEFTEGLEFVSELKRPVTFFGSARTPRASLHYQAAVQLARKLGREGYTIITGGGAGIMEAANKGAHQVKAPSVGLNIQLPFEQRTNKYVQKSVGFYYFFSRKSMLATSAQAYVFFPGGYGTMDEFFTIVTLIETGKIEERPIVLYGDEFWKPFDAFIKEKMLNEQSIDVDDASIYSIVNTVDEAFRIIQTSKERQLTFM